MKPKRETVQDACDRLFAAWWNDPKHEGGTPCHSDTWDVAWLARGRYEQRRRKTAKRRTP